MPRGRRNSPGDEYMAGEAFCEWTGETDSNLRRLAKLGYLPKPIKGFFHVPLSIKGLLRYYREMEARLASTRHAKHLEELRRLRFENDVREGKFVRANEMEAMLKQVQMRQRQILREALLHELPLKLEGLRADEMLVMLKAVDDEIVRQMQELTVSERA